MSKFKPLSLVVLMVFTILPLGVGTRYIVSHLQQVKTDCLLLTPSQPPPSTGEEQNVVSCPPSLLAGRGLGGGVNERKTPYSLQAQSTADCPSPDDLPPGLAVGWWARVASGRAHNLREEATIQAAIIGQVPDGDIFRVLDGPRCADGYLWWAVDYAGQPGWIAEGDAAADQYWLALLAGQEAAPEAEPILNAAGCHKPPEDYGRALVNGETLNTRTLAMLDYAQALYRAESGIITFRRAVMQGSYNPGGVSASFGTHDGGGAVDLSVRDPLDRRVLTAEIEPMLRALRLAGFAAWLRDTDLLYPGSPIHIHAIAIGDADLSEAARGQIDGTFGYLRGYDGLPHDDGIPQPDTSGDMVLCDWMKDMGYTDLRDR